MQVRLMGVSHAQEAQAQEGLAQTAGRLQAGDREHELRQAAVDFEALFIHQLLSTMRRTVPKSQLFPESPARDIFEGMLDEELAGISASAGGLGLSQMLLAQLGAQAYNPK